MSNLRNTKKQNMIKREIMHTAERNPKHINAQVFTTEELARAYNYNQQYYQQQQQQQQQQQGAIKKQREDQENLLHVPQINSSAKILMECNQLKALKINKDIKQNDLTPQTKELNAFKITKKMNFAPDEIVFKNLVPLNVNDSMLLPTTKPNLRKKYQRSDTNRIPVPDLADFLDPIKPIEIDCPEYRCELEYIAPQYDCFQMHKQCFGNQHPLQ